LLAVVALSASVVPAMRAARIDPVRALADLSRREGREAGIPQRLHLRRSDPA
jgi:hypothetical protein